MNLETLTDQILALDSFVWQPLAMPLVLVIVGGLLTLLTGGVQIRRFPAAVKMVFGGATTKREATSKTITPFQALTTALAATVGNGNIGGVATAILIGGPGAVFWMWVTATVGMATKYAEALLGVHYRVTRESGELASGPMYYISRGVPQGGLGKILALAFAFFGMIAALFGTGNMAQSNTVARTAVEAMRTIAGVDMPPWVPGIIITILVGLVLIGGLKRIARTAEAIVPTMLLIYVTTSIIYIVLNAAQLPEVFGMIFAEAFSPTAAIGGFVGASVAQAIASGVSRGVLSNEAGLGSAPIAHGVADVRHPVQQGLVGVAEVFIDTIVVCSMTAFIILSSGMWTDAAYQNASGDLTAAAMSTTIPFATAIVAMCSFLFGFSTLIAWYYYGEKCFEYIFGSRPIMIYKTVFVVLIFVGAVIEVRLAWAVGTLLNSFMAFPNLVGLVLLLPIIRRITMDYFYGGSREFSVDHPTTGARVT
ncbi:MAG: sodium:alanine symporter family protein [Acidobacteria bacterium]|nr:sodium:alanine symporter family protein [Acidobacteriota bacterium]MBA3885368.1 sodium:alanine symporter family protein [Acidobacteriota bacterium]